MRSALVQQPIKTSSVALAAPGTLQRQLLLRLTRRRRLARGSACWISCCANGGGLTRQGGLAAGVMWSLRLQRPPL